MSKTQHQVTRALLHLKQDHSPDALQELWDLVYPDLKVVAGKMMVGERDEHILQPTALVHEAYLKLVDQNRADWKDRAQFFAVSARIMRRVLVDHAREHSALKRGGDRRRVSLHTNISESPSWDLVDLIALDKALSQLDEQDSRVARVVEMRIFAGLPMKEIAHALDVSKRTADSDWAFAYRWLAAHLEWEQGTP